MSDRATAFAPASIGNVAAGFDMLGLAVEGVGDRVTAMRAAGNKVSIASVRGPDGELHKGLSNDAEKNTASIAAQALWAEHGKGGLELEIQKGTPLRSGMGSSAASAVAGAVAANALLESPLQTVDLLPFALEGERYASQGLHADNVAPSLLGGLVLCPSTLLPAVVQLPTPGGISSVILHPDLEVDTAESRKGLSADVSMTDWVRQQGLLATFVAACYKGDIDMLAQSVQDVIIEPQRAASVRCFDSVIAAADEAGALGGSLSGSGPSIFALVADELAQDVATAMEKACLADNIHCQVWVSPMNAPGARIEN